MSTHALYRFRDAAGRLLYVGITADPGTRWKAHAAGKPWWADVARVDVEPQPTREAALAAEKRAIRAERPVHNVIHNRPKRAPAAPTVEPRRPTEAAPRIGALRLAHRPPQPYVVGAVIAHRGLGMVVPPVGRIVAGDRQGFTLALYHWSRADFTAGEQWVRMTAGVVCRARDERPESMAVLADFQAEYTPERPRSPKQREAIAAAVSSGWGTPNLLRRIT